jgi:ubiquitin-conjugating enzyme E2 D/E
MRRLKYEFSQLQNIPDIVYDATVLDTEFMNWEIIIYGPPDTPYEKGKFKLDIHFTTDHPFRPPKIKCKTKIYHPNISSKGHICIDILKTEWSPALSITKVLLSLSSLLNDPNTNDPLVQEIADIYEKDKKKYEKYAREWTSKYAV